MLLDHTILARYWYMHELLEKPGSPNDVEPLLECFLAPQCSSQRFPILKSFPDDRFPSLLFPQMLNETQLTNNSPHDEHIPTRQHHIVHCGE